jgi:hypothetical protein
MNTVETLRAVEAKLHELHLNEVYGVTEGMHKSAAGKTAPCFTFCKSRILDGVAVVWGAKFIQVKWETAIRDLPHRHSEVFKLFEEFDRVMTEYFGKYAYKRAI